MLIHYDIIKDEKQTIASFTFIHHQNYVIFAFCKWDLFVQNYYIILHVSCENLYTLEKIMTRQKQKTKQKQKQKNPPQCEAFITLCECRDFFF